MERANIIPLPHPSPLVILSKAKDLVMLRTSSAKNLIALGTGSGENL